MYNQPFYPIGIQDFEKLRSLNALYVDKTELIYKLVHTSTTVFLSRPRRFGKSLLSSTLQYYFEGRKDLFTGLAMERLEQDWTKHPVLHFDLSMVKGKDLKAIEEGISFQLRQFEAIYGKDEEATSLSSRLSNLIQNANTQSGQKVVIIIDEYDAPILDVLHDEEKREAIREMLRAFYTPLKACDRNLRFVFLTGISMFSQLSIFSELNNLEIISRRSDYASICGITEQELRDNFQYGIEQMSEALGCSSEETVSRLRDAYDGYHFCADSDGIFNPFSLLNAFKNNELDSYWFRSGTPRFLIEMLTKYKQEGLFDVTDLDSTQPVDASDFESPLEMHAGALPLLYQAGYLTIKDYDAESSVYTLGIPNSEVRVGLLKNLLPLYADIRNIGSVVSRTSTAFRKGDIEQAMQLFQSMLASIPYMRGDKEILSDIAKTEAHYHIIFYFFFRMLYNEVYAEIRNATGATDVTIKTTKYIYLVEIKIDSTADAALRQIDEKGYATPYLADGRQLIKLGINFSTATRTISAWRQA
jgi:AcrR family transcriptional regulator